MLKISSEAFFAVDKSVQSTSLISCTSRQLPTDVLEDHAKSIVEWVARERGLNPVQQRYDQRPKSIIEYYRQLDRRPIIGANCLKHRNYHTIMMAQPMQSNVADQLTLNGTLPIGACFQGISTESVSQMSSPHRLTTPLRRTVVNSDENEGIDCSPCCNNDNVRRTFRNIVYGQILSLCLCGTGVSSQLLNDQGVNTPTAQSFLNYFLLCAIFGSMLVFRRGNNSFWPVLRSRGWRFFLLSLVDVEANFVIVYAYQFTNLTSIQLLDCSTIPMVLLLSWLFLSTRYLVSHIIGVAMCLVGIAVLIWADALDDKKISASKQFPRFDSFPMKIEKNQCSNRLLGDVLCLAGSVLYAVGNVGEEYLVKHNSRIEYLGMIGLFGSIISGMQLSAIFEHRELAAINWSGKIIALYLLFAVCMFTFYSLVSVLLQKSSALMFNLSILTADFYSLLFGLFLFKYEFHVLYFLSFALVIFGSLIYSLRDTEKGETLKTGNFCNPTSGSCLDSNDSQNIQQQHLFLSQAPSTIGTSSANPRSVGNDWSMGNSMRTCPMHSQQAPNMQIEFFNK